MDPSFALDNPAEVFSPALLFSREGIIRNIHEAIRIAGGPARLRPHVKTHKTREIVRLELDAGITRHKCATIAEAELLASAGALDVFLAYNLVGPNIARLARLVTAFPPCRFSVQADHLAVLKALSEIMTAARQEIEVLLDLDLGQHRTGIAPGPEAASLYEQIDWLPGLVPAGLHLYDGHNHQENLAERKAAVDRQLESVLALRAILEKKGLPVPRLIAGGTPTFPVYARLDLPGLEFSPGTCILHDHSYSSRFPDMGGFHPAALLLTRVISLPPGNRLTLDLGYKAVASDPPPGKRCVLLNLPDYEPLLQNEEHFVVQSSAARKFQPGDVLYAIPSHVCPTVALHREAYVVERGRVIDRWTIAGRDRVLTF